MERALGIGWGKNCLGAPGPVLTGDEVDTRLAPFGLSREELSGVLIRSGGYRVKVGEGSDGNPTYQLK